MIKATGNVVFFKTYYNAKESFHWKGMYKDIQKYVAECDTCQRNKSKNVMTPGLLHPLHIPTQKWEEISMDFIEGVTHIRRQRQNLRGCGMINKINMHIL